jgi:putative transposase
LAATGRDVGIDLGVCAPVATSDGRLVLDGRYGQRARARLATAQRHLASKRKGSRHRQRTVERVAAAHRKVRNQRKDLAHKLSRELGNSYDLIVHEDLKITNMVRRPRPRKGDDGTYEPNGAAAKGGLNRAISDAGWGQLLKFIVCEFRWSTQQLRSTPPMVTPS